ncbi:MULTISPECIES: EF-P beta-lysylation protein EpmB [unclassified Acinetobacter]|uniref:EF-P beta-lysylation protein EpmB n=1 Tax=unclassified Acinetobacter TaxID=196816 RepID=UPI0035BAC166
MINYLFKNQNWQSQLNDLITDPFELLEQLKLTKYDLSDDALLANQQFRLRVPRQFVAKMQQGNAFDPLLLQVLPHHLEMHNPSDFITDPLHELQANPHTGLLHKYASRVLLTLTGACAIHCRYCFRRHFPYNDNMPKSQDWLDIQQYIVSHPEINEIILSGGDPLSLTNQKLKVWLNRFSSLTQIKTIRFHTRLPVVIPQRIDAEFLQILDDIPQQKVMVVHANHAQELDQEFDRAMHDLRQKNVICLNQSVLLKGINDNSVTLSALSYRLFQATVLPYYLHVLDKVAGSAHFYQPDSNAIQLQEQLRLALPGYLVPKLVREVNGELSKTPL